MSRQIKSFGKRVKAARRRSLPVRSTPEPPRRPPMLTCGTRLANRVEARGAARAAAPDAAKRQPAAGPPSMAGDRLLTTFGNGQNLPALIDSKAHKRQSGEADE